MRGQGHPLREGGFTVVEMMVTAALLVVVMTALLNVLDKGGDIVERDQARNYTIRESQVALHRMALELRQAYRINGCGKTAVAGSWSGCTMADYGHTIDVNVRTQGNSVRRVIYDCSAAHSGASSNANAATRYRTCTRSVSTTTTGSPARCCAFPSAPTPVIRRVMNWCVGGGQTCPTPASASLDPIFTYKTAKPTGISTVLATPVENANPTGPEPRLATKIDLTMEVPTVGERRRGMRHNLLLRDGSYLRNIDL
jgi:hypothetical protein